MWMKKTFNRNVSESNSDRLSLIYPHSKNNDFNYGSINSSGVVSDRLKINKGKSETKAQNVEKESISGIWGLFRYSSSGDRLLMLIGILFSIFTGASFPVLALVFGQMTNRFIIQATHLQEMTTHHMPTGSPSGHQKYAYSTSNMFHRDIFNDFSTDSDDAFVSLQTEKMSTTTSSIPLHSNFTSHVNHGPAALSPEEFSAYMGRFSLYYLAIGFSVLLCAFIQTFCWELAAERQVHRLHGLFFSQILRQDVSWYDMRNREEGDLTTKLSDDLERIREGIGSKFSMVTQYLSTFFSGIAVGLIANWRLTTGILCLGPILIGTSAYLARNSSSAAAREQLKYSLAGGVADEVLNSIRTVVAFGGEHTEIKRYDKALEEGRRLAMKKYYVMAVGASIVFFLMYAAFGVAFWYGAELIGAGKSTPGSVFTVFFSVMAGAFSVGNALPFVTAVSTAIGAARTIFGIIDRVPDIDPYSNNGYSPYLYSKIMSNSFKGHILFKDVHFAYPARPDVPVLKGLNVEIEPGKRVALVGNSGAGKSTVVSLLMRFYNPSSGEILIDGMPLRDYNLSWLRNQIGIVSQEPVLFGMSIEENIKFGYPANCDESKITSSDIIRAATLANAHKFISDLPNGYATLVGARGAQLSGGQKQRIAIARAIIRDPKILLLDEATSALDTQSEGIVQDALDQAMKGRTTIIIAHRLSTVRNADVIYALKDGVVGEVGNHDQLMALKGLYYNLVTTQTQEASDEKELSSEEQAVKNEENQSADVKSETTEIKNLSGKSMGHVNHGFDEIKEDSSTKIEGVDQNKEADDSEYEGSVVWRLLKLNSPEWFWLLLGILGCGFAGMTMPTFAFFYGQIFSTFTLVGEQMRSAALFWSLMFLVLASVTGLSYLLQISFMTLASEKLVARMRLMAFQNIVRQSIGWFDVEINSPGRLITKLARDAPMVKQAAGLRAGHLISALVTLLSALTIAFIYGWKLACLLVVGVPLIAGASFQQTVIIRRNQTRDLKLMDSAGRVAIECVTNIRTVQGLNKELLFLKLYNDYLALPFKEAKKQSVVYAVVFSFSQAIIFIMYAAAFKFGAYLIKTGDMTPTDVYRVFFALAFCAAAVGQTSAYVKDYFKAKLAAHSLFKLIECKSEIDIDSPNGIKPVINGKVTFDSVHFKYPSRPDVNILNGISFTVEPGKSLALVGSSGCGKSTVVALLERFYNPTKGNVIIDDFDIRSLNLKYLRRNIGLVTQEPVLFNRSIKDNILYGIEDNEKLTMDDVIKCARAANIHNFIVSLPQGYDTFVGEGGSKLSGGQKQRVAIARALIRDPKILLLDEATSALDTESEKIVQEALDRAREGRTCIIIAHRLSTIQNADCIAVIHQGVIVEQGTHEELKNKGQRYYQLIKRQNL